MRFVPPAMSTFLDNDNVAQQCSTNDLSSVSLFLYSFSEKAACIPGGKKESSVKMRAVGCDSATVYCVVYRTMLLCFMLDALLMRCDKNGKNGALWSPKWVFPAMPREWPKMQRKEVDRFPC